MSVQVITQLDQVNPAWLTSVLSRSGALLAGSVAAVEFDPGRGNWSTNASLTVRYADGSTGALPGRLFLKLAKTNSGEETFDDSEVTYYLRDYLGVEGAPLVRCYDGAFSAELGRYHLLLEDLTETHLTAAEKTPTLAYGMALAEGLAAMHARWWGEQQFLSLGATRHTADQILRFVQISEMGGQRILDQFTTELEPHWPEVLRTLFTQYPRALIARNQDHNGFTLIHGDVGHHNVMVPREADQPIYIIDRQPFDWSLTTWLGAYDLAYAMVLDWEVETRRRWEIPILKHYHETLIRHGVNDYAWERLWDDYRLCVAMCVYVAAEYFRGTENQQWVQTWLLMLRRSLTAWDELRGD
jgi:hypothetical protein